MKEVVEDHLFLCFFAVCQSLQIILGSLLEVCFCLKTSHNEKAIVFTQPELPVSIWTKTYVNKKLHLKLKCTNNIFLLLVIGTKHNHQSLSGDFNTLILILPF